MLNSVDPNTTFPTELESGGQIRFLNTTTLSRNAIAIIVDVYRNASYTDHYLDLHSHCDREHKFDCTNTLLDHLIHQL